MDHRSDSHTTDAFPVCSVPFNDHEKVVIGHGGGGKLTHDLIEQVFRPAFDNAWLAEEHDGATVSIDGTRLAMTTDAHVVSPLFFPGGDIGALAVNGTVNDLVMCGARPLYLTVSFVLEEGLPMATLRQVVDSMKEAARSAKVQIVAGDTKVVDKGKADGLYVTTAGVGLIEGASPIAPAQIEQGDAVILSGDVGRHGIAIMAAREGLDFETTLESDQAALKEPVRLMQEAGLPIHCLRDLTRGGLATALVELAQTRRCQIEVSEQAIPVAPEVQGACEILGLDPLYVACEGRFILFVPQEHAPRALEILQNHPLGLRGQLIGQVTGCPDAAATSPRGGVTLKTEIGTTRPLFLLSGEQLPRIC